MEFNDSEMLSLEIAAMEKIYKSPSFYPKSLDKLEALILKDSLKSLGSLIKLLFLKFCTVL